MVIASKTSPEHTNGIEKLFWTRGRLNQNKFTTNLTMRQRCSSIRGTAALTSFTVEGLQSLSAIALARGLTATTTAALCLVITACLSALVGGVAQWLGCWSLAGGLSLTYAWSKVDMWPLHRYGSTNSAFHPSAVGKWVVIHVNGWRPLNGRPGLRMAGWL